MTVFNSLERGRVKRPGGEEGAVGLASYNALYGEGPLQSGTFIRLKVYKMVEISQVQVYEWVQKSVI